MVWQRHRSVADTGRENFNQECCNRPIHHGDKNHLNKDKPDHFVFQVIRKSYFLLYFRFQLILRQSGLKNRINRKLCLHSLLEGCSIGKSLGRDCCDQGVSAFNRIFDTHYLLFNDLNLILEVGITVHDGVDRTVSDNRNQHTCHHNILSSDFIGKRTKDNKERGSNK